VEKQQFLKNENLEDKQHSERQNFDQWKAAEPYRDEDPSGIR